MPSIFLKKFFFSFTIIFMVFFFSGKNFAGETLEKILAMKYIAPNVKQVIGFTNYDGNWKAENEIVSVNAAGGAKLVCDAKELQNLTEGEISVDIFCPSVADNGSYTNAGILLKVQKPSSGADAFVGYEIAMRPENQQLNVGRHRFNYEPIARVACENSGVQTDQWWTLRVRFRERSFDVFVNDNAVFQYEDKDAPILSGGIALRPWLRPARYRNLRIKTKINSQEKWTNIPFAAPILSETEFPPSLDVKNLPPILVLTRSPHRQPSAVGQDLMQSPFEPGCSLRIIEPANPATPDKIIFSDNNGCIYDMNLSLDAKTVYFSYKKSNESFYNLWKIGIDGKNLERLTNAPFCDVSPCEIPGGDLVFVSTRRFGYTVCQPGPASNLHRLIRSGGNQGKIYCISMNTLSDMSPQMLPDGRVMFTRWEYVDRDLTFRQSVWTQNPDGTAYQLFFGNTIRDVGTFWQARPLPNQRNQVVATFAPHHGYPHGAIGIIDRNRGIEGRKDDAFRYISPEFQKIGDTNFPWGYRDPFPISDSVFLCSYGGQDGFYQDGKKRFKIYLLDSERRKRLIYEDKEQSCFFPIAIRPSENIAVAEHQNVKFFEDAALSQINENAAKPENMGTLLLINVYEGLQDKVAKGTIKSLRIMEQVRKTEELVHRAYDQSPVMSYGTYYAKRCWGTVPVEEDGSAYFYAPAMREIYLQALDADGREVQRMTSALQLTAGESTTCIGCHESRDAAPPRFDMPIAAKKSPAMPIVPKWLTQRNRLNPQPDSRVFDYPSVVQPVLDKYCVSCHQGNNPAGGYDLTGDKTRYFSMSYDNLLGRSRSYRQHDMEFGGMLPEDAAKGKPLVQFFWLLWTPSSINQPYEAGSYASRLTELIDSEHYGVLMPLEERQKIYFWIDANVPYYGTYAHSRPAATGRRDRFAAPETGALRSWFSEDFLGVWNRRCAECHQSFDEKSVPHIANSNTDWSGRYAWINLSHPETSPALTAHFPKENGGRGIPLPSRNPEFFSRNDSDFQTILHAIQQGHDDMTAHPEADMSGFRHAREEP